MQVILVKPVRKLGKVGETVNVKNGYGRNYLIPSELAVRATKENIAIFTEKKKEFEEKNALLKREAETSSQSLEGKHLTYVVQAAADGRLFGSISQKDMAAKLSEIAKFKLDYSNILIDNVIKATGVYTVQVALHPEVITSVLVVVAKSESEAVDALRDFNENGASKQSDEEKEAEMLAIEAASSGAEEANDDLEE
jgi:large subunit ribosomal protein L9